MSKEIIMIKSFKNGINVVLDPDVPFEELYVAYAEKFRDSAHFFKDAKRVLSFEGRKLSELEERALVEAISEYTDLRILCIVEEDEDENQVYYRAANSFSAGDPNSNGQIYKGCVHSGQRIETPSSIIILGDVNPGAEIVSNGSVVVLGCIYGDVKAGAKGDEGAFVAALDFKSTEVGIADKICKTLPKSAGFLRTKPGARIVYIANDEIEIDEISKEFLMNLPF